MREPPGVRGAPAERSGGAVGRPEEAGLSGRPDRAGLVAPPVRPGGAHGAGGLIILLLTASAACFHGDEVTGPTPTVSVDDIYWAAWRDPDTFDAWLSTQTPPPNAASCLQERADLFFQLEEDQLVTCRSYSSGSRSWNECHDQAESYHNGGVVAQDIARTLNGTTRFADTSAAVYLTLGKAATGTGWTAFINSLRELVPPLQC